MGGSFSLFLRIAIIAVACVMFVWHPSPQWVERAYANGAYPQWQAIAHAIAAPLPWSLGDIAALVGVAVIVARVNARLHTRQTLLRRVGLAAFDTLVVLAVYGIWFNVSWGWNYDRPPIEERAAYDASRVTPAAVNRLRSEAIAQLNALAAPAHARADDALDLPALAASWTPAVQAAGDVWTPRVGAAKPSIADPFMVATGTEGFINPLTLTSQLASDLLWFERPFSLAHEWSHVAAYAREDEANYLAIVTCLRSPDPTVRYSGWLELFLYLPPLEKYKKSTFVPLVWQDFNTIRTRNARHINATLAHWSWHTYNAYLKSKRIASGVKNYNEVTRLYLGVPLDADGLPVPRRNGTPAAIQR
jgi:hypothetical protein